MNGPETGPAVLLQLPMPRPQPGGMDANIPLAPACLAAYAALSGQRTLLAPRTLQDHGGDGAILAWLEEVRPSILGFTTYLWNIERSMDLARAWCSRHPGTVLVMGGPEIAEQDVAEGGMVRVAGEGEAAWRAILELAQAGLPIPTRFPSAPLADPAAMPNPYLAATLEPVAGGSVYLETVRGCGRRCTYCRYGKTTGGLRPFPRDRIARVVALARDAGAADLYVMDPCFNAAPDYMDKLRILAQTNTSRIALHTEIELESVTHEAADLYARAGFASVETGLQTTHRPALRAVRRGFGRDRFARGAKLLMARGIRVRTGVILGLPHETPRTFRDTIRFVQDLGLGDDLEVHPLSVLPGTGLAGEARGLGLEFMDHPPYWVLSNGHMKEPDLEAALEAAQTELDTDFFPPVLPRFANPAPGITGYQDLRPAGAAADLLGMLQCGVTAVGIRLTLLVSGPRPGADLARLGQVVRAQSPHTLVQIVVDCPTPPPWEPWERIAGQFHHAGHYLDRVHYFHPDPQGRFSVRFFHLTSDPQVALAYYRPGAGEHYRFDPIVRYGPAIDRCTELLDHLPILLVDTSDPGWRTLVTRYQGHERLILVERRS